MIQSLVVFPTCVGVFPAMAILSGIASQSSPRAWGCFSDKRREYDQKRGLPHVRGGVSKLENVKARKLASSPRAWGCFQKGTHVDTCVPVFPTCVGVFLSEIAERFRSVGLPHVRGGVSAGPVPPSGGQPSSPRAWGCF